MYGDAANHLFGASHSADENIVRRSEEAIDTLCADYFDARRWRGYLRASELYDDNPAVFPASNAFIPGIPINTSAGTDLGLNLQYDVVRAGNWELTTEFNSQYVGYHSIPRFDLAVFEGSAAVTRRTLIDHARHIVPATQFVRGNYQHILIGGDSFLQRFTVDPGVLFRVRDG